MREAAVIVESVVDVQSIARSIAKEHIALQDCDRALDVAERKSEGLREQQRRHRVEIGRLLIEAKRGIQRGGWEPYIEKLGIAKASAWRWMEMAGYVEEQRFTSDDVKPSAPTLRDAGIDRRPRKRDESAPRAGEQPDPPRREPEPAPALDIDRELSRIQDKLCAAAATMPASVRKQVAHELRETARIIEEMS